MRGGGFAGNQITTSAGNLIPAKALALVTSQSLPVRRCAAGNWGLMKEQGLSHSHPQGCLEF